MKETKFEFEVSVDDIKTSRVKDDTCPISGEFNYQGTEVKVTMLFKADAQDVFDDMFGGVGKTVTFAVVDNKQQTL
jgi:hypothetical protein